MRVCHRHRNLLPDLNLLPLVRFACASTCFTGADDVTLRRKGGCGGCGGCGGSLWRRPYCASSRRPRVMMMNCIDLKALDKWWEIIDVVFVDLNHGPPRAFFVSFLHICQITLESSALEATKRLSLV